MDRNEWSRRQLGSDNVGRPVSDPLGYGRYSDGGNAAPKFTSTAVTSVVEDVTYTYNITTSDADLDTLTITATTKPDWLTFTDNTDGTATLTGTPDVDDVGDHAVTINVSDGTTSRNQHFTITVTSNNNLPVFSSTPVTTVDEDSAYSYSITVTDADPDTLVITAPTKPDWLTFTDNTDGTATLTGTPDQDDVGTHSVVLSVTDGEATVTQSFDITVSNVNDAPVFTSTAPTEATEDEAYSYSITVTDEDGDTLTITAPTKPAWLTLVDNGNGTATLSGTPADTDAGDNAVVLSVTDGTATVTQSFTIDVEGLATDPVNTAAPSIAGAGYTGQTLTATAGTWDTGTATGQWYADGVAISGETGSTYVVSAANHGAAFKYVEANGGVIAESNVIHHQILTDIAGLEFWIDRNLSSYLDAAGQVSQVNDISGKNRHAIQNSGPLQPSDNGTLNGRPAFEFDASRLDVAGLPDSGKLNFFSVSHHESTSQATVFGRTGHASTYMPIGQNGSNSSDYIRINGVNVPAGVSMVTSNEDVIATRGDAFDAITAGLVVGFLGIDADDKNTAIGGLGTSGWDLEGPFAAASIYSGTLNTDTIDRIMAIMAWSYGWPLVSGHPYKSSPPTV